MLDFLRKLFAPAARPVSREWARAILSRVLVEQSGVGFDQLGPTGKVHLWVRGHRDAESLLPELLSETGLRSLVLHAGDPHDPAQGPAGDALLALSWPREEADGRILLEVSWTYGPTSGFGQEWTAEPAGEPGAWHLRPGRMTWTA